MEDIRIFEDPGIGAMVFPKGHENCLEIGEYGVLAIPPGFKPEGFHLTLFIPTGSRIVIIQKNVGQTQGGYHRHALAQVNPDLNNGFETWAMVDPIDVMRVGNNVWTSWHQAKPNRVDVWDLEKDGSLGLFQIGVITHDNGQTFQILGEWRWRGTLVRLPNGKLAGNPMHPKWGPLSPNGTRDGIFEDARFKKLLADTNIPLWEGGDEQLESPLDPAEPGFARVQWFIPFAGQTGQGIAILHDGTPAWVHGADIMESPDSDGLKRLWRNDLIQYRGQPETWGVKQGAPPKIVGVQRA